jgi:hypothetical protein
MYASERVAEVFANTTFQTYFFSPPYKNDREKDERILSSFYEFEDGHDWVLGHSDIGTSQFYDKADMMGKKFQTCFVDGLTLENFRFPLSKGIWLSDYSGDNIPCVIGGKQSSQYKVGDVIEVYTVTEENIPKIDYSIGFENEANRHLYRLSTVEIVGVLEKPEFSLGLYVGLLGSHIIETPGRVSKITEDVSGEKLFAFAPLEYFEDSYQSKQSQMLVYCDKAITDEQKIELGEILFENHVDISGAVQSERTYQREITAIILPFVVFCGIVAVVSMFAMCVLTALGNMEAYKMFLLVGASNRQVINLTLIYSGILSGATVLFYTIVSFVVLQMPWIPALQYIKEHYYSLPRQHAAVVLITVIPILCVSFAIPFVFNAGRKAIDFYKAY